MISRPEVPYALPALLLAAVAFGAWMAWSAFKALLRYRLARSPVRGQRGEVRAARWLERHGFTIVEEQASRTSVLMVDGQPCRFEVRADFVVRKSGRLAVIEVKTGLRATHPDRAPPVGAVRDRGDRRRRRLVDGTPVAAVHHRGRLCV